MTSNIWSKNLFKFHQTHKKRGKGSIAHETASLGEKCKMPLKTQIIGRYQFLGAEIKGRKDRVAQLSKEIMQLWEKRLNFPCVSEQVIRFKINVVLKTYDKCVRLNKYDELNQIFDVTKQNGQWLSSEDKMLYNIQIKSNGEVGYSTGKFANVKTIHPSKRLKNQRKPSSVLILSDVTTEDESEKESQDQSNEFSVDLEFDSPKKRKYNKTKIATNLVTSSKISTNKAAKICKRLAHDGIEIPTPSQAAIYKSTFREAVKLKDEFKNTLKTEHWSLHFDGKQIEKKEYQVCII